MTDAEVLLLPLLFFLDFFWAKLCWQKGRPTNPNFFRMLLCHFFPFAWVPMVAFIEYRQLSVGDRLVSGLSWR